MRPSPSTEPLVELETDKIAVEVNAEAAGRLADIVAETGANVEVGAVLGHLVPENGAKADAAAMPANGADVYTDPAPENEPPTAPNDEPATLSPAVRRLIEENGLDPAAIRGTGKDGRILKGDVLAAVSAQAAAPSPAPPASSEPAPAPPASSGPAPREAAPAAPAPPPAPAMPRSVPEESAREERVPMTRLRKRVAERLKLAQNTAAMLTTFNEVDMTNVLALRKAHREAFEAKHGVRLGFMSFFVKAAVAALRGQPMVNAEIDGDDIVYKHYFHIGVAVSAPQGLVVPVLRDADRMSFAEIERTIGELGVKARDNKLAMEDLVGGTFTISNGGVFGSLMSTPILNPPQSAILGMHKIQERPMAIDGQVVIRPMMYLALSYDHRLIDGREAVTFLVRIKDCIEDPERLLLDL